MMTREQNIRAILDSCFAETKDELKDIAFDSIMSLLTNEIQVGDEVESIQDDYKAVVVSIVEWKDGGGLYIVKNNGIPNYVEERFIRKTGKRYSQMPEILKQLNK